MAHDGAPFCPACLGACCAVDGNGVVGVVGVVVVVVVVDVVDVGVFALFVVAAGVVVVGRSGMSRRILTPAV